MLEYCLRRTQKFLLLQHVEARRGISLKGRESWTLLLELWNPWHQQVAMHKYFLHPGPGTTPTYGGRTSVAFPHHESGPLHLNRPPACFVPSSSLLLCSWYGRKAYAQLCFPYDQHRWRGPSSAFSVATFPGVWAVRWSSQ